VRKGLRGLSGGGRESSRERRARRSPRHAAIAVALAVATSAGLQFGSTAHAASRTVKTTRLEARITQSIRRKYGVTVTVACPGRVPVKARYRFTCVARLAVGTYPLHVVETDARGTMYFFNHRPLRVLNSAKVAAAIEHAVRMQRQLTVRVTCPSPILEQAGLVFRCVARGGGARTVFKVTEQRGGYVRFVGQ